MKSIFKIAVLLAAVLMLFCVTGCGDNAGGSPSSGTQPQTQTPSGGTQTQTPAEPQFVAQETPLTLEAIQAGTIMLNNPEKMTGLKYRKNGGNFVSVTADANTITVAAGDKIAFYASGSTNDNLTYFHIGCNHDCYVYGNVMSLLSSSNFENATSISTEYALAFLFDGNTHIKNHTQKALVLPATTLATGCYWCMFQSCSGLTSAPALPATTLVDLCYCGMFSGCSNLNSVTCLATDISAENCTFNWLDGVASSGTFTKESSMSSWPRTVSGIPSDWTVVEYPAPQQ